MNHRHPTSIVSLLIFVVAVLSACATAPPLNLADVNKSITPNEAVANIAQTNGRHVLWGGQIVTTRNLKDVSEMEILAYPVDASGIIQSDKSPLRRFIAIKDGYLESADYAKGRFITLVGQIDGTRSGKVDEASYAYPLLRVEQLHLWPQPQAATHSDPNVGFHIGIGVVIH